VEFTFEAMSREELARLRTLYEPLTQSVRDLLDATIRTQVDEETIREARAEIDAITEKLRAKQLPGAYGVRIAEDGEGGLGMAWGNPVIGLRNAVAPPLVIRRDDDGRSWAEFTLGAAYEGPPGHVHGGICALVLDHILGEAASDGGLKPFFPGPSR
jgi:hypothetical protein